MTDLESQKNTFRAWLNNQPKKIQAAIASRAALRVLPLLLQRFAQGNKDFGITLPVFQASAYSWAMSRFPERELWLSQPLETDPRLFGIDTVGSNVAAAVFGAAHLKGRLYYPVTVFSHADNALNQSSSMWIDNVDGRSEPVLNPAIANEFWVAGLADATRLREGMTAYEIAANPLWLSTRPDWSWKEWQDLKSDLDAAQQDWQVWTTWYEDRLLGYFRSDQRELIYATLENAVWEQGAAAVNAEIKRRIIEIEPLADVAALSDKAEQFAESYGHTIPAQSPAPVRVEERDGKIAKVSDRNSPLNAVERDFNGWREPVLDHVQEFLSGDFRDGTNHSRARDRLLSISNLLAGSIEEVKERQFRVGYDIERLGGLLAAYRSDAEDMPELNAALLEDLTQLHIALMLGVGKLERWAEFQRAAKDDPTQEGSANPAVISDALERVAVKMEQQPKYFDPELPATFRFLAEAMKDPFGATKSVVFGGWKSLENVVSFLGQKALGIAKNAIDGVEQHISKAVARFLILTLSAEALQLSGALPAGWAWLKPLLEALAKSAGGS